MAKSRAHIVVAGYVQGVGFRYSAQHEGSRLGLGGWVRNLPTGDVEAEVEGDAKSVDAFVAWCHRGPVSARVESVDATRSAFVGDLEDFVITR
jgi:acylphosphatase